MPGRPTRAQELGLTEEIVEDEEGHFRVILTNAEGSTVFDKEGYSTAMSAHKSAGLFLRQHYRPPSRPGPRKPSSGQSGQILDLMRTRAQDNESQAQRLRSQADLLETEAKRLTAAADILEGPELGD
jgi:hypothetical protein